MEYFSGVLLALGSGLSWAGLDVYRKLLARHLAVIPTVVFLTLGQTPLFVLWLVLDGHYAITPGYVLPGLLALLCNTLANLLFVRALHVSPFSLTIPLLSLTPVFTTLVGIVLLQEYPTMRQTFGIVLVMVGIFALHQGDASTNRLRTMLQAFRREPGSVLMVLVALLWSISAPLDKLATAHAAIPMHAALQCAGIAVGLGVGVLCSGRGHTLWPVVWPCGPLLGAIVCSASAFSLQLLALQVIPVRLIEVMKRVIGLLMAVLLGRVMFHEPLTRQKMQAIVSMAMGTALVLL